MRYVYRLDIVYPKGSREYGWEPETWQRSPNADPDYDPSFRWPRERLYLSRSGADQRAMVFRHYGAKVTVVRSQPVEWD